MKSMSARYANPAVEVVLYVYSREVQSVLKVDNSTVTLTVPLSIFNTDSTLNLSAAVRRDGRMYIEDERMSRRRILTSKN